MTAPPASTHSIRHATLSILLLLAVVVGCNTSGSATNGGGKKYRIAVIPKGTTHEFWKSVHAGAEQAAKEFGNVEILWKGPLQENDREGQINVVQDFITRRVSGICLAPLDSQAMIAPVRDAQAAGIPTVIFDSGLDNPDCYVSYVATDNYQGGVLAAREMGKLLNNQGNVIVMRYNPGSESTEQREDGFLETLAKDFSGIKILSSDQYSGTTPESSLDKSQQLLLKFGDKVNGMFAVCEPNGMGMLRALEGANLAGKVKFIGFDPSPTLIQAMDQKKVNGIVLQDPIRMGYLAVKTMVEHLQGKPVEKRISTGETIATPENMKEPKMEALLNPPQF
jgi:ribose transport system substrate-binding protein